MLLPVGTEDFARVIDSKLDFVDKSLLIKAIFDDRANDKIVFTRPRRFGKTFNLSMLHCFLAAKVGEGLTANLFDNLKITQCGDEYMRHQGKYPVISITLKNIRAQNYEEAKTGMAKLFSKLYSEHRELLVSTKLLDSQKKDFEKIILAQAKESELKSALQDLTYYLFLHYGKKPWLLIDEYDTPIQFAYSKGYYIEMIDFMRGLLGAALKTNLYLDKAVITGILRIGKESLFSGLNNLKVYSILNSKYSEYFGFTEAEVDDILKKAKLTEKTTAIKQWYNGYQIGGTIIYNPWSIANCIQENGTIKPYWVNTSDNELIKDLLKKSPLIFKENFELLLSGKPIEKLIDENLVFHYLNNNPSAVWTLLLMAGYLTPASSRETYQGVFATLEIPNKEVRNLYRQIIEQWLSNGYGLEWYNEFIALLLAGNIEKFKHYLDKIILQITSYHDFAKEPEAFYQGLMLGFTVSLHSEGTYEIKSNRESGLGRFDIMLIPKDISKLGIIIELKVATENESPEEAAVNALKQIGEKKYIAEMQSRNIKQSVQIGIGFCGKNAEVRYTKI